VHRGGENGGGYETPQRVGKNCRCGKKGEDTIRREKETRAQFLNKNGGEMIFLIKVGAWSPYRVIKRKKKKC